MHIGILLAGQLQPHLHKKYGSMADMFVRLFKDENCQFTIFDLTQNEFPQSIEQCDAWLITGSASSVYEPVSFLPELKNFVRTAFSTHKPIVGICFGHQLIAAVQGATVQRHAQGWCIGTQRYDMGEDTLNLHCFHQDQVLSKPRGAKIIATSDQCSIAALKYADHAISFQAHPEFSADFMEDLIDSDTRLPDEVKHQGRTELEEHADNNRMARAIMDFLHNALKARTKQA